MYPVVISLASTRNFAIMFSLVGFVSDSYTLVELGNACEHHPQTFAVDCADANRCNHFLGFFAVLAASLKSAALGAAFVPGLFIFSPDPALIRALLAISSVHLEGSE